MVPWTAIAPSDRADHRTEVQQGEIAADQVRCGDLAGLDSVGLVELLERFAQLALLDERLAAVRSSGRGRLELKFKIEGPDGEMTVVSTKDASRTAVVQFTVQPGSRFAWHTRAGPVVVDIDQGALTYVDADDCDEQTYNEGEAFADPGHGHVHSAYNPGTTETALHATFFEAPQQGPLSIPAATPDCAQEP